MNDDVERDFTTMERIGFYPNLGGWQYEEIRDERFPYTAYRFFRYIGAWNFRRLQENFRIDHMFGQWCVKSK
jgi:hypothetical protein